MLRAASLLGCLVVLVTLLGQQGNGQPSANKRSRSEQQATPQPSPTPPNNGNAQVNNEADAARATEQKERDAKDDAFKAEQLRQNRVIVTATIVLAIFGGLSVLAAFVYAILALKQLREIKKQADSAGEQVKEMKAQSKAVEAQGEHLRESLEETRKMVAHNERLTIANEAQKDAMNTQAGTMAGQLEAMREQVILATKQVEAINISERAYIGIETIGLSNLEVGKIPRIVMIIKNAGNTPAKKIKAPGIINIERAGNQPQEEIAQSRYIGDGMLASKAVRPCVYEFTKICDENMLYQITSQNWIVFFRSTVWYEDVWGNEWSESFFLEWDSRQQAFLDRREKKAGEQERQNPNEGADHPTES